MQIRCSSSNLFHSVISLICFTTLVIIICTPTLLGQALRKVLYTLLSHSVLTAAFRT